VGITEAAPTAKSKKSNLENVKVICSTVLARCCGEPHRVSYYSKSETFTKKGTKADIEVDLQIQSILIYLFTPETPTGSRNLDTSFSI
jgi:hypothetical protein